MVLLLLGIWLMGQGVEAQSFGDPVKDLDKIASDETVNLGKTDFATMAGGIIYGILSFLGVASLLLVIVAGVMWMMAEGNEETVQKAKGILRGALIGLIIILGAYALTYFVVEQILQGTGVPTERGKLNNCNEYEEAQCMDPTTTGLFVGDCPDGRFKLSAGICPEGKICCVKDTSD